MNVRCQQDLFFKKEDYGYSAHFTTKELTEEQNCEHQKWHMLPLKSDFFSNIKRNGCLPVSSLSEKLALQSKLKQYEKDGRKDSEMGINVKAKLRNSFENGLVEHMKSPNAIN